MRPRYLVLSAAQWLLLMTGLGCSDASSVSTTVSPPSADADSPVRIPDNPVRPDASADAVLDGAVVDSADVAPTTTDGDAQDVVVGPDPGLDLGGGVTVFPSNPQPGQPLKVVYRGNLADRDNVSVHYGFNGWNQVANASLTESVEANSNRNYYRRQRMDPLDAQQGYTLQLDTPSEARSIHMVFFSSRGDGQDWDNNKGDDYTTGIGHLFIGPYLTVGSTGDLSQNVFVNFTSGHHCKGRVELGPVGGKTVLLEEPSPSTVHRIELNKLVPGTRYEYRASCFPGQKEAPATFETIQPLSPRLTFIALSDAQDSGEGGRFRDVLSQIQTAHMHAAFIVISGDMPWDNSPGLWWTFFDRGRDVFRAIPLAPAMGNHDRTRYDGASSPTNEAAYDRFFPSRTDSRVGRLEAGPVTLLTLNSEFTDDFAKPAGKQFQWVQQQVNAMKARPRQWNFAAWHQPPYNASPRHASEPGNLRGITSLFDGVVDWVFTGHVHTGQRFKPLRYAGLVASAYGRGPNEGVGYMILPPAGAYPNADILGVGEANATARSWLAFPDPPPGQRVVDAENGFAVIDVDGQTLSLSVMGLGNYANARASHVVDHVVQRRP